MFARFFTLLPIVALASVASAMPNALEARDGGSCNASNQYCCQQTLESNSAAVSTLAGILGVVLPDIPVLAGLTCTNVIGASCSQSPVCCDNVYGGGLLTLDCDPITL